jgi:hypothetical protein
LPRGCGHAYDCKDLNQVLNFCAHCDSPVVV